MKTVGIDIGTTTISAVVLHVEEKKVLETRTVQNGSYMETGREWERVQDVSVIIKKAQKILDELLERHPEAEAIGLTSQMHGILYLDEQGNFLSPLYTWEDGRGDLQEFEGKSLVSWIKQRFQVPVATGYGLVTHLYHCKKKEVPKGSATICTIGDYLGMVLTKRKKPLVHASNAASFGFFDSRNREFQLSLIREAGMDVKILPDITNEIEVLGTYKERPVYVSLGDNQASFLGAVGLKENSCQINVGTGGQISILSRKYFEEEGIEARPFLKGNYILTGSVLCAGRAYAILEKFLRAYAVAAGAEDRPQYDIMAALAKRVDEKTRSTDELKVCTLFKGTRIHPELRGNVTGISEDNFLPENLIYGVMEGMVREYYDMYRRIHEGTGVDVNYVIASGNGVRKNEVLRKIFSRMFQTELILAELEEEAACGAAISMKCE